VNERLVYCAITGYGQDGPSRDLAGHDINYLGYAGVLDMIGEAGGPPIDPGVQIADVGGGGLMAAVGILAAVAEREQTGRGRFVDISMTDGAFTWMTILGAQYSLTGEVPARGRMRLSSAYACYRLYRCADDKWLAVGALEPQFWARLCGSLGADHLTDRQFSDEDDQRGVHAEMEAILAGKSRDEWVTSLIELDACVGPVNDVAEAYADPHLRARGMIIDQPVGEGTVAGIGNPVRLVGSSTPPARPAPGFGEHTDAVLAEAGYDAAAVERLRAAGAI
jgi:crotonobetainyl-CoA:carnitine CoA-transferase CaiB-like acyl-CoA transferase